MPEIKKITFKTIGHLYRKFKTSVSYIIYEYLGFKLFTNLCAVVCCLPNVLIGVTEAQQKVGQHMYNVRFKQSTYTDR